MIRVPTEVIKTRTQTSSYGAAHASSFAAMKMVLHNEGISGFYRGFTITVMREASIHNSSPERLLTALLRSHSHPSNSPFMNISSRNCQKCSVGSHYTHMKQHSAEA